MIKTKTSDKCSDSGILTYSIFIIHDSSFSQIYTGLYIYKYFPVRQTNIYAVTDLGRLGTSRRA